MVERGSTKEKKVWNLIYFMMGNLEGKRYEYLSPKKCQAFRLASMIMGDVRLIEMDGLL
jgi:hypothetical protein